MEAQALQLPWVACMPSAPLLAGRPYPELWQSTSVLGAPFHHLHIPLAPSQGFCSPFVPGSSNGQARACFSSLFLPSQRWAVAGSLHICSRSGTARLSCRSCLGGSHWQGSLLQDPLWSPLSCSASLGRAAAAFAVLCFSPLCLQETPKTTIAFPALSTFSIKPV